MKLRRISFENFRSFKETADLGLIKPVSSFVGSNNAGKSNIFEIFSFLRRMIDHQWSRPFEELSFDRNKKPIKLEIEFELDDADRLKIISSIGGSGVTREIVIAVVFLSILIQLAMITFLRTRVPKVIK